MAAPDAELLAHLADAVQRLSSPMAGAHVPPNVTSPEKGGRDPSGLRSSSAEMSRAVLVMQQSAGNRAVQRTVEAATRTCGDATSARSSGLQRSDPRATPPTRPKPRYTAKKRTSDAPMSLGEVYVAIGRMEPDPIDDRDLVVIDRSNLRILHGFIEGSLTKCREIQTEKARARAHLPPGLPDRDYDVVERRLRTLDKMVLSYEPYGTLNAILAVDELGSRAIGSSKEAQKLWKLSWEKTRDLLWHEDLGTSKVFSRDEALGTFGADEILTYGYVFYEDTKVWRVIHGAWARLVAAKSDPDDPSPKLSDSAVVQAIKVRASLVPVDLASFLMSVRATATTAEIRKKLTDKLDSIDQEISTSLNKMIMNMGGGRVPWSNTDIAEDGFIDWAKNRTEGVYGVYNDYVRDNLDHSGIFPEIPLPE